jgi:hypothetical protein
MSTHHGGYENPFHSMLSSIFQGSAHFSVVMASSAEMGNEEFHGDEPNTIEEIDDEEEEEDEKENVPSAIGEIGDEIEIDLEIESTTNNNEENKREEEKENSIIESNPKKKNSLVRSVVLDSVSMDSSSLVDEQQPVSNTIETNIKKQSISNLRKLAKEKQIANEETINKMKKNELIKIVEES